MADGEGTQNPQTNETRPRLRVYRAKPRRNQQNLRNAPTSRREIENNAHAFNSWHCRFRLLNTDCLPSMHRASTRCCITAARGNPRGRPYPKLQLRARKEIASRISLSLRAITCRKDLTTIGIGSAALAMLSVSHETQHLPGARSVQREQTDPRSM